VLQDVFLFSGSVADNISLGREDVTQGEIERAATAVEAHRFVERLPDTNPDDEIGEPDYAAFREWVIGRYRDEFGMSGVTPEQLPIVDHVGTLHEVSGTGGPTPPPEP